MAKNFFPWRNGKSLADVLLESRRWLVTRTLIHDTPGSSESAIIAVETRLGRPLPADIRAFHQFASPTRIFSDGGPQQFGFYQLDQDDLRWESGRQAEPRWTVAPCV